VDVLLDSERRRYLWTLALPALAYGLWYLEFGRSGVHSLRSPFSLGALQSLIGYVPTGIGAAAAGLLSLSIDWSQVGLAALVTGLAVLWYRAGRIDGRVLGAAAGIIAQFALTGLVRAQLGDQQAGSPRYV